MFKAFYPRVLALFGAIFSLAYSEKAVGQVHTLYGAPPMITPETLWQRLVTMLFGLPRIAYILMIPCIVMIGTLVYLRRKRRKSTIHKQQNTTNSR